jgi:ankyrin repeat protein
MWQRRLEERDDEGMTMMLHAAAAGCTELVKFFLAKGINKSQCNEDGFTAVHLAAYQVCM